jgi:hypothetical protein
MVEDRFYGLASHLIRAQKWIANQIVEACGWERAPQYLICDGIGLTAIFSYEDFDRWAFAIDRRRRAPRGKRMC